METSKEELVLIVENTGEILLLKYRINQIEKKFEKMELQKIENRHHNTAMALAICSIVISLIPVLMNLFN